MIDQTIGNFDFDTDKEFGLMEDLNAFEIGAAVAAAGIGCASVGITAVAAPTAVIIPGAFAGGMYLAGYNQRHGHLPFMGDKDAPAPAPVTQTPAPPAVA